MKNFTLKLFAFVVALFATSFIFAQETTYTDDFSVAHDYLTGVEGSIWETVLLNNGLNSSGVEAEITALNTTDNTGSLAFATINSYWDVFHDGGAALVRTVKGGADFEMQVKIVGGDYLSLGVAAQVNYLMSGLIAKVKDDSTFLLIQAFDIPVWNAVIGMRDIDPAEGLLEENWLYDGLTIADFPYQKLEKYGTTFTGSYSADGSIWNEIYSVEKPEFTGKDIQVGLYSATYTTNEGRVIFDDFSLIDYSDHSSVIDVKALQSIKAVYHDQKIVVANSSNKAINNVKLYSTNGAVIYNQNNINSSSFSIPVTKNGLYIMVSESAGKTFSQKIAVY
jgi:regulation of enolase protein 1 (concanavalin A-like superfamily)